MADGNLFSLIGNALGKTWNAITYPIKNVVNNGSSSFDVPKGSGSSAQSFENFYNQNGYGKGNPYSFGNKIGNFFTGSTTSAEQAYQNYLADYEFKRNQEASAKANQETYEREDSQIQRLIQDYQKAGLNPYMILNSGNLSSGAVSSQSQKAQYKKKALKEGADEKLMSTAIRVLALVLLKKAI